MTDYSAPTQDDILESAIDSNQVNQFIPTESDILLSELRVPVSLDNFRVSLKSTEIAQPETPVETIDLTPQANIDSILNGKLFESMISPVTNFIENVKNVTNNYLGKNTEVLNSSEKLVRESLTEIFNTNTSQTEKVLEGTTSLLKDMSNLVEINKESVKDRLEQVNNSVNSSVISSSSILDKISAIETNSASLKESAVNSIDRTSQPVVSNNSSTLSNISLRNNKLIESSEIKNILTPDRTLEKTVSVLSKTLPEAVNNLSTSVTSISPTSNSNTSNFVEGAKIDQSTSTVINQNPNQIPQVSTTEQKNQAEKNQNQMIEHYMQAIYAAIVSGKIRVKLENY